MKKKLKVYIAGPITGQPQKNRPAFRRAEKKLLDGGYEPVNPHSLGERADWSWADYMRACLRLLVECDGILRLPGWQGSRGAQLEAHVAQQLGLIEITAQRLERKE